MKNKFQTTVQKMLERDGDAYTTARNILNFRVMSLMGLGLDDLPDTTEVADAIEAIADAIDDDINEADIKMILSDFNFETVEQIIYG